MLTITAASGRPVDSVRRRAAAGQPGFGVPAAAAEPAAGCAGMEAVAAAGLFALQEGPIAAGVADREARRHGNAILDALAALQRQMLRAGADRQTLEHLAALAEGAPAASDPGLQALLTQIALRSRVELARYGFA